MPWRTPTGALGNQHRCSIINLVWFLLWLSSQCAHLSGACQKDKYCSDSAKYYLRKSDADYLLRHMDVLERDPHQNCSYYDRGEAKLCDAYITTGNSSCATAPCQLNAVGITCDRVSWTLNYSILANPNPNVKHLLKCTLGRNITSYSYALNPHPECDKILVLNESESGRSTTDAWGKVWSSSVLSGLANLTYPVPVCLLGFRDEDPTTIVRRSAFDMSTIQIFGSKEHSGVQGSQVCFGVGVRVPSRIIHHSLGSARTMAMKDGFVLRTSSGKGEYTLSIEKRNHLASGHDLHTVSLCVAELDAIRHTGLYSIVMAFQRSRWGGGELQNSLVHQFTVKVLAPHTRTVSLSPRPVKSSEADDSINVNLPVNVSTQVTDVSQPSHEHGVATVASFTALALVLCVVVFFIIRAHRRKVSCAYFVNILDARVVVQKDRDSKDGSSASPSSSTSSSSSSSEAENSSLDSCVVALEAGPIFTVSCLIYDPAVCVHDGSSICNHVAGSSASATYAIPSSPNNVTGHCQSPSFSGRTLHSSLPSTTQKLITPNRMLSETVRHQEREMYVNMAPLPATRPRSKTVGDLVRRERNGAGWSQCDEDYVEMATLKCSSDAVMVECAESA